MTASLNAVIDLLSTLDKTHHDLRKTFSTSRRVQISFLKIGFKIIE